MGSFLCQAQQAANSSTTGYTIASEDANSRVWEKTTYDRGTNGQLVPHQHHYTELATGLNHRVNGQWVASKEEIDILPDGTAAATNGQHQVYFPADIYNGVITMVTPDGLHLKSRPVGLFYDDGTNTIMLAELTNSVGELANSNQVIYPSAFAGLNADLSYTYKKGSFEQDVILHEQPTAPESLGLNPTTTKLQMLTEFLNAPEPQIKTVLMKKTGKVIDKTLHFGKTFMGKGRAFLFGDQAAQTVSSKHNISVQKDWIHANGRKFLVEEIPFLNVRSNLQVLPYVSSRLKNRSADMLVSSGYALPSRHSTRSTTERTQLASKSLKKSPEFVMDYIEFDEDEFSDFTFQAGDTYLVTAPVILGDGSETGNSVIFESGAVIKFTADASTGIWYDSLDANYSTNLSAPVILTSVDDNSFGESIGTGSPVILTNVIYLSDLQNGVANFNCYYAGAAMGAYDATYVTNCQFFNCLQGIQMGGNGGELDLYNDLFSRCTNPIVYAIDEDSFDYSWLSMTAQNVTADEGYEFESDEGVAGDYTVNYINCLATRFQFPPRDWDEGLYVSNVTDIVGDPYASAGGNNYYLANGSLLRSMADTNSADLFFPPSLIESMTTYAPQNGSWPDTNGTDVGFHYSTIDTNGLPYSWEEEYFGQIGLNPNSDPDGDGANLQDDYESGIDPNVIQFSTIVTNNYINSTYAPVQLSVSEGIPFYYAVVVDDTNYQADASWQTYSSSNILVNLGSTQGWHSVWIGLRGLPSNATQTWKWKHLKLETVPPVIVITNSTPGTVSVPVIQLYGYCSEELSGLSYDISNALGVVTNLNVDITDQYYDTNIWDVTTNTFQCMDVPLTNGLNLVTVHATDMAGNIGSTNLSFTLDYTGASNPVIQLIWPQNGMQICQGAFTLRGWTGDSSSEVAAQIVDTNGDTNVVAGVVERTGILWAENLPLAEGTNFVTLWVTNAAGLSSTTNFTVVKNDMTLALTNVADDLWLPTVTVSGLVSDPAATISVNGVEGINNGDGTWDATNVPVSAGGVASFDISADSGGGDPDASTNEDKPTEVIQESFNSKVTLDSIRPNENDDMVHWKSIYNYSYGSSYSGDFDDKTTDSSGNTSDDDFSYTFEPCPGDNCGEGTLVETENGVSTTSSGNIGNITWTWPLGYNYSDFQTPDEDNAEEQFKSQSTYKLLVGGKSGDKYIAQVSASLLAYDPDYYNMWQAEGYIPFTSITIAGGFGTLDSSGNAYRETSGGEEQEVTPIADGNDNYTIIMGAGLYQLTHVTACTATGDPDNTRQTIGIGEGVNLGGMPGGTIWTISNGFTTTTNSGSSATLTASMSPVSCTASAQIDDVQTQVTFKVLAPSGVQATSYTDLGFTGYTQGSIPGSDWIGANTKFYLQVLPNNVSFLNMQAREVVPGYTWSWPSGDVSYTVAQTNDIPVAGCGNVYVDKMTDGPLPIYRLYQGTGYLAKSFPQSWVWQYENQSQQWVNCATIGLTTAYDSNARCRETYQGMSGDWQGPWIQQ